MYSMEKINIIVIEDQREVLEAIAKDLTPLEDAFGIEECATAAEALDVMAELDEAGEYIGLIISDHVMPQKSGVDFLIDVSRDARFAATRKVLLTGLATHQDTIQAINQAHIDQYLEKPWTAERLITTVKILLAKYILEKGIDYEPYLPFIDQATVFEHLRKTT